MLAGFLVKNSRGKWFISTAIELLNIHPSLIPSFCGVGFYGLHVHEAALAKGVKVTGATVHYVDEGMDTGEIIFQKAVDVLDGDTPETLQKRVMDRQNGSCSLRLSIRLLMSMITNTVLIYIY